jgi:hypothetical protein
MTNSVDQPKMLEWHWPFTNNYDRQFFAIARSSSLVSWRLMVSRLESLVE